MKLIILMLSILAGLTRGSYVFRLEPMVMVEEPPIGTLVLDLASKLDINDLATSDYKFRFYSPHSLAAHYFLIDQLTGHVKTQRTLDREYLCETKVCGPCGDTANCSLPIEIVATQSKSGPRPTMGVKHQHDQVQKFVSFDVIIEDKNEFAPKFSQDIIYINVSEAAPVNFSIPVEAAVDRDSTQTVVAYSLEPIVSREQSAGEYESELKRLRSKVALVETIPTSSNGASASSSSSSQLNLILLEPFDYELEKEMRFRLVASDGPSPADKHNWHKSAEGKVLTSSVQIVLKIVDINDNLPVFDSTQYEYRLDEDKALPGTRLIRVHATDRDDGANGLVKYSLTEQSISVNQQQQQQQQISLKSLFTIDELTGWISVSDDVDDGLDYELMPTYRLVVKAQDSGVVNSMPVYTNVIIYLNDVNDNPPQLNLTLPSSIDDFNLNMTLNENDQLELSEWTVPNTFVAQIHVADADSSANGRVKLEMSQFKTNDGQADIDDEREWIASDDFTLVHLFNNIYSLMTRAQLDREQFNRYLINLTAVDHGQPPLATSLKLVIKIRDENDNKPVFSNGSFEFNVTEMLDSSTVEWISIGQVKATDADEGQNGLITYKIEPADQSLDQDVLGNFDLHPVDGVLRASTRILDRELGDVYELLVSATDAGLNRETARVRVNIHDLNDNRPLFDMPVYKFQLKENVHGKVGHLRAFDADKPNSPFSLIRYKLVQDEEDDVDDRLGRASFVEDVFRLDEQTGELSVVRGLDYEQVKSVQLKALAYDSLNQTGSLNSTCVIQIELIDVNDNKPRIEYPRDADLPLIFSLDNVLNTTSGMNKSSVKLSRLVVTDADSGANARLTYTLNRQMKLKYGDVASTGSASVELVNLFDVDARTGQMGLKPANHGGHLRERLVGIYALVVDVSDEAGESRLTNRAYVFVALTTTTNQLVAQIGRLRVLLNQSRLNDQSADADYYGLDDDDDYDQDPLAPKNPDARFERILNQLRQSSTGNIVKLSRKKPAASASGKFSLLNRAHANEGGNLHRLREQLFGSFAQASFFSLLLMAIVACVILSVLFASLCLLSAYYKRKRPAKNTPIHTSNSSPKSTNMYSDNSFVGTKTASPTNSRTNTTILTQQASSASPSSHTSSELLVETSKHGHKIMTFMGQQESSTLLRTATVSAEEEDEEERAVLILNSNSSSGSNQLACSSGVSSSSEVATTATASTSTPNKHNPLLVLVAKQQNSSSTNDRKILVASSESLSSVNTMSNNGAESGVNSTSSSRESTTSSSSASTTLGRTATNNFKTFKHTDCSPKQQTTTILLTNSDRMAYKTNVLTADHSSYRTMPAHNSYRHESDLLLVQKTNRTKTKVPVGGRKMSSVDQKPLNLPVNELFKRYELKRQATANPPQHNGSVSSGSVSSLNSLQLNPTINKPVASTTTTNKMPNDVSTFSSPRLTTDRRTALNAANSQPIPDYFFKDEKEHKKFLSASGNKQIINLKVVDGLNVDSI